MQYPDNFETERLIIRRFTEADWPALMEYGKYRDSIEFDRWEKWPFEEEECKNVAKYFAASNTFWAVERKSDNKALGFISFNEVTDAGHLDMGHGFLPSDTRDGEAVEAIRRMVEYIFTLPGVTAVEARNPEAWTEQITPVAQLGFKPFADGRILMKET